MERAIPTSNSVADTFAGWCFPRLRSADINTKMVSYLFLAASYLTDPVCKVREYYWQLAIIKNLHPDATKAQLVAMKFLLYVGALVCGTASIFTTLPGIALRYIACQLQKDPFIYLKGEKNIHLMEESPSSFTLLSWNVCCVAGGYAITDGGVAPWTYRIDQIVKEIKTTNANVVCLYEVFDSSTAFYLYEKLKDQYVDFYFNIGPKAVGVSSGMFIASQYPIQNPCFTPFFPDDLVGRTKNACKGFFSFEIAASLDDPSFARIHATHLQHSEEPAYPTKEEQAARQRELGAILAVITDQRFQGAEILTGDLNLDEEEWKCLEGDHYFSAEDVITGENNRTWGGDQSSVKLLNNRKRESNSLNLDHTFAVKESVEQLDTHLLSAHYSPACMTQFALSDHQALYTTVHLKN